MKGTQGKKKVKKWSTEERKDKPSSSLEEGTKEMRTWRSLNQEETDQCWKNLAERMEVEVLDKNNVENSIGRLTEAAGMEACAKKQKIQDKEVVRRLMGKNLRFVQRLQPAASAKHA